MSILSLKNISQGTWINTGGGPEARIGLCYYMCNFIESNQGIWNAPATFQNALKTAQNFAQGTAMINYAKAQLTRNAPQIATYASTTSALLNNRLYRCCFWFGPTTSPIGIPNHEILILTGNNDDVIYFEPNFGFFQPSNIGMNNRQALEYYISQQYGGTMHVGNFEYLNIRGLGATSPLGFN